MSRSTHTSERSGDSSGTDDPDGPGSFDVFTAAHQLRTPLTAIAGFAELLMKDDVWLDTTLRKELLRRILKCVSTQSEIIEQWLEGGDAGRAKVLAIDVLELRAEIDELMTELQPLLARHLVEIEVPSDLRVVADKSALAAVLSNLLTNAAKYCPAGSPITITAEASDGFAQVVVHNEGDGIEDVDLERIFGRGYRAVPPPGSTADGGVLGSGLGLGIARELITQLGGRIWADSGVSGTDFTFTVPAASSDVARVSRTA